MMLGRQFVRFAQRATSRRTFSTGAASTEEAPSLVKRAFQLFAAAGGLGAGAGYAINTAVLEHIDPAAHERDGPSEMEWHAPRLDYSNPANHKYMVPPEFREVEDARQKSLESWSAKFASIGGVQEGDLPLETMNKVADLQQKRADLVHEGIMKKFQVMHRVLSQEEYNEWEATMLKKIGTIVKRVGKLENQLNDQFIEFKHAQQNAVRAAFEAATKDRSDSEMRELATQLYCRRVYEIENAPTPREAREEEIRLLLHREVVLPEFKRRGYEIVHDQDDEEEVEV
jgi:hypothetical protein